MTTTSTTHDRLRAERCARCGLDVAAHRVVASGAIYCTAFCAKQAMLAATAAATFACPTCRATTDAPLAAGWRIESHGIATCPQCSKDVA